GLLFAQGLLKNHSENKMNFNVKIFERDAGPEARLQGYRVSSKPFGVKSLINCLPTELSDRLNEILPDPVTGEDNDLSFMDEFGELLTSFPSKKFNNVRVQWNKKFVRYEIDENGVWAYFDDGTKEFGDILVGSDGVNSLVHKQKLPDLEVKNLGVSCVVFDIAPSKNLVERFSKSSYRDSVFKISLGDCGDNLAVVFRLIPVETKDSQDDDIHYRFTFSYTYPSSFDDYDSDDYAKNSEFCDVMKEMLDIIPEDLPSKSGSVGDAIHAMNPVLGLGMNHAMRDADKLSQSLLDWDEKGWEECIKNYEDEMINRCSPDVLNSRKLSAQLSKRVISLFVNSREVLDELYINIGNRLLSNIINNKKSYLLDCIRIGARTKSNKSKKHKRRSRSHKSSSYKHKKSSSPKSHKKYDSSSSYPSPKSHKKLDSSPRYPSPKNHSSEDGSDKYQSNDLLDDKTTTDNYPSKKDMSDDVIVGPVPLPLADARLGERDYGGALLAGEGSAMAAYVQEGKRIPRRGEIGLTSNEIQSFEGVGFVMSGSRQEEKSKKENKIISDFRELLAEKLQGK
ncbi:6005_t:CDS:10, partial [Entrophospora sp. SA101]